MILYSAQIHPIHIHIINLNTKAFTSLHFMFHPLNITKSPKNNIEWTSDAKGCFIFQKINNNCMTQLQTLEIKSNEVLPPYQELDLRFARLE